ncbi:hypothetical protein [Ornithinimicrobium kibberense]|uniref:hypothetical protein n=1 Tax=Ornithinimicrobium kibberense TaxID=282060 RepID=UPI003611F62A
MTRTIAKGPTVEPRRCPVALEIRHAPTSTKRLRRPCPVGCSRVWNMSWRPITITTIPATVASTSITMRLPRW